MTNRGFARPLFLSTLFLALTALSAPTRAAAQFTAGALGPAVTQAPERDELALAFRGSASPGSLLTVEVTGPPQHRVVLVIGTSRGSLLGLEPPLAPGTADLTEVLAPGFRALALRTLDLGRSGFARVSLAGWRTGGTVYFQANPVPPAFAAPSPIHALTSPPPGSSAASLSTSWVITAQRTTNRAEFNPNISGFTILGGGTGGPGTQLSIQGTNLIGSSSNEHDVWVDHATAYFRVVSASPTEIITEVADVEASGTSPLVMTLGDGEQVPVPPLAGLPFDPLWVFESIPSGGGSKVGPSGFSLTTTGQFSAQAPPAPLAMTAKWKKIGDSMVLDLKDLGTAPVPVGTKFFTQVNFQYNTPAFQARHIVLRTDDSGSMTSGVEPSLSSGLIKLYLDLAIAALGPKLRAKIVVSATGSLITIEVFSKKPPNTLQYKLRAGRGFFRMK